VLDGVQSKADGQLTAQLPTGHWVKVPQIVKLGHGIPQGKLEILDRETVRTASLQPGPPCAILPILDNAWCPVPIRPGHPNTRFPEMLEFCALQPDRVVYVSPSTDHCPVMHFDRIQIETAEAAGIRPPIAEGPSQYGPFENMPQSMRDIFWAQSTAWPRTEKWVTEMIRQCGRVQDGYRFSHADLPGGKDGLEYGITEVKPPYGAVAWRHVEGQPPEVVRPRLPDKDCAMNLDRLYRVANELQIADQEVVSETRLYGVRENLWVSAMTGLYPNYAGAWTAHESMLADRERKRQMPVPRVTEPSTKPLGWPLRTHPLSSIEQSKPNGKKKFRPIRDAGAKRQPRARLLHKMVKRVSRVKRMRALKQQVREAAASAHLTEGNLGSHAAEATVKLVGPTSSVVDQTAQLVREASELLAEHASALLLQQASAVITEQATEILSQLSSYQTQPETIARASQSAQTLIDQHKSGETAERSYLARKGKPGIDSVNACVDMSRRAKCSYGAMSQFTQMVDILLSSGLQVDLVSDDFTGYYEQWPVDVLLQWFCAQIISAEGMEFQVVGDFGFEWYPNKLNRTNFVICDIIAIRLRKEMRQMSWTPWSAEMRSKAESFSQIRQMHGQSGDWFAAFPWFDDNSSAVFECFRQTLRDTQYRAWKEFALEWAPEKVSQNLYGCFKWDPIVGFDVRVKQRVRVLPAEKVNNYCALLDSILSDAAADAKQLVPSAVTDSAMGKLAHAIDVIPTMWDDFIQLIEIFNDQEFTSQKRITRRAREHIAEAIRKMRHENGIPFTAYKMRPGLDDRPLWQAYSDASLRKPSFYAAAGGWFKLHSSDWIFFFVHEWTVDEAQQCANIGELEMMAADITAHLQMQVHSKLGGCRQGPREQHYLLQMGDNSAVFDSLLPSMRATARGMRFLARQRARAERQRNRMCSAVHVHRNYNAAADALANADIGRFACLIRQSYPQAALCRLAVPVKLGSLKDLNDWTAL
jgi:hypothetical protein